MAIRSSPAKCTKQQTCKGNGLPHQRARWFAMTYFLNVLLSESGTSAIENDIAQFVRKKYANFVIFSKILLDNSLSEWYYI